MITQTTAAQPVALDGFAVGEPFSGGIEYVAHPHTLATDRVGAAARDVLAAAGIEELFEERVDGLITQRDRLAGKPASTQPPGREPARRQPTGGAGDTPRRR